MTAERITTVPGLSASAGGLAGGTHGGMDERLLARVSETIAEDLRPRVGEIDLGGVYPEAFMRRLGAAGGYAQSTPARLGGTGAGVGETIRVIEEVSKDCMSTGFCVWCQTVLGWYVQNGRSEYLKGEVLPEVISGESLAGTGLSNPMKHFAGIERIKIKATPTDGGYLFDGTVPWISNVGEDHYFAVVANCKQSGAYIMAVVRGDEPGVSLGDGGHFVALEGSSTMSVRLKEVFVPEEAILAAPAGPYVERIRPGFVLTQTGFGLGVISSCVALMRKANSGSRGDVNGYLDDGPEKIEAEYHALREEVISAAEEIGCGEETERRPGLFRDAVAARLATSELSLRASQAAMLHLGAAGYRTGAATERKLRESYFVAIVTPAAKHLKKLLYKLDNA